jgi:hypothetical protein
MRMTASQNVRFGVSLVQEMFQFLQDIGCDMNIRNLSNR